MNRTISIRGARQHNLKDLDLEIPLNRMTVVTGVSGSGKSSLAFDTLYAEGQRRYVETFSPYARQFMDRMDRPEVDDIDGVPPAIAIDRKAPVRTSRSTVGTMTEVTDYVKLLYARLGQLHCRQCGRPVRMETPALIWRTLAALPEGTRFVVTFPLSAETKDPALDPQALALLGFDRVFLHGRVRSLHGDGGITDAKRRHIVVDRGILRPQAGSRVISSLEQAFRFGGNRLDVWTCPPDAMETAPEKPESAWRKWSFSNQLKCAPCDITYTPPVHNLFSFNSPLGACEACRGFGRTIDMDMDLIIPDPTLSLEEGAIKPWGDWEDHRREFEDLMAFCHEAEIPTDVAFQELTEQDRRSIIEGTDHYYGVRGFFNWLESKKYKMHVRVFLSRYRTYRRCARCRGTRFKEEARLYRLAGLNIGELYALNVDRAWAFFDALDLSPLDDAARLVLGEIQGRLQYLRDVGLGYLTLDRQSRTLSGGEVQRVALASALGSSLVNTLYVLDEPSIGLHPRDCHRLIRIMKGLRDLQNTLVVVEHDAEIIRAGDYLLDLGPGAGAQGGAVMYFGPTSRVHGCVTGAYLTGERAIAVPGRRRPPGSKECKGSKEWIRIEGACEHNLKGIDVDLPLGRLVCLTGVSGSGKSTLAEEILYKAIKWAKWDPQGRAGCHTAVRGLDAISDVVLVDQKPIGRTPRANALTYTKAMDPVRNLFAGTAAARAKGFGPGHFSFNVAGGRCETCRGEGFERVEMQFLSDVFVSCPDCKGKRFKKAVLDIRYRGKNIDDVLSLTVSDALICFQDQPKILTALTPLARVGLDYLRLGQPVNTLSGGEAQRLKLSRYLAGTDRAARLFIFDEPTTGLHFQDIEKLMAALQDLVQGGHSVLMIEHNMDVIKLADWIIDLGPEGGEAGGTVVAAGPPEEIARVRESHTGRFLKTYLGASLPRGYREAPEPSGSDAAGPASSIGGRQGFPQMKGETGPPMIREPSASPFSGNEQSEITVRGAREHNLKDIRLAIPREQLVVLTGVSGSGKSTLAFDILFAEGQRRYLESLTPYVRQYVQILERPEVDIVSGLPPTVAIEQRVSHASRRSTVATLTEIYHFLRLLYSKVGRQHCTGCGRRLAAQTPGQIVRSIEQRYRNRPAMVLAPKVMGKRGFHKDLLARARRKGFSEARIDGQMTRLQKHMALTRYQEHTIEVMVGRVPGPVTADVVRTALREGNKTLIVVDDDGGEEIFSEYGTCPLCGVGLQVVDPRRFSFNSKHGACPACEGLGQIGSGRTRAICSQCDGSRLRAEALAVKVDGYTIWDMVRHPLGDTAAILADLSLPAEKRPIAEPLLAEIQSRLAFLQQLGLAYLSLSRSGDTLSGGEAQRVRLAAQLGSNLTGVCYVLDEPTIGLHARDHKMLLGALKELRDRGNSILVVEHDEETIRAADHIIDLGPGAGQDGGHVVAAGDLSVLQKTPRSVTGASFKGRTPHITSRFRPYTDLPAVTVCKPQKHNLKGDDLRLPLGALVCVTGVSGSGKSTLLMDILYHGLRDRLSGRSGNNTDNYEEIIGWEALERVLEVDHSPIGKTPRSVPGSYVGVLPRIRGLFAATPEARARGYTAGRFSFNVAEGRCASCKGHGSLKIAMSFLPDVYIHCEACGGKRFNRETLAVTYKGKNMAQVLDLTFDEAADFFAAIPAIYKPVHFVSTVGLGYLRLGQASPTLSGGEAQRIKLAKELSKTARGRTLYILDEPTTGLHLSDIRRLMAVLQALVDQGNTVAVIEHNMEVIKEADCIIDLGPGGGEAGGRVVATGSPAEILSQADSAPTAAFLNAYLS